MEDEESDFRFIFPRRRLLPFNFFFPSHLDSLRDAESHAIRGHARARDSPAEREDLHLAELVHGCFESRKENERA